MLWEESKGRERMKQRGDGGVAQGGLKVGLQGAPKFSLALETHPTAGTCPRGRQWQDRTGPQAAPAGSISSVSGGKSQAAAGEQSPGRVACQRQGHRVPTPSLLLHPSCSIPPATSLPLPQPKHAGGNFCARANGLGMSKRCRAAQLKVRGEENKAQFP